MALTTSFTLIVAAALALFIALGLIGVFSGTLSSIVPFAKGPALKPGIEQTANAQCLLKCTQAGGTLGEAQWFVTLDVDGDGDNDEVKCKDGEIFGDRRTTGSETPLPKYITGSETRAWSNTCQAGTLGEQPASEGEAGGAEVPTTGVLEQPCNTDGSCLGSLVCVANKCVFPEGAAQAE